MKDKTKAAYLDWKSEAEKLRLANECDPEAFTAKEFERASQQTRGMVYQRIIKMLADGRAIKTKKRSGGRLVTAYKMVKPA